MKDISIYSGAGNDFVVLDWRGQSDNVLDSAGIMELCAEHGTDGLMLLREGRGCDFRMEYFNSDGSGGMMCGNGGRCIVAFASSIGIEPAREGIYLFEAADGLHRAEILAREGTISTVRLGMRDPSDIRPLRVGGRDGWFINTGTRHFVTFVEDTESVDIETEGALLRQSAQFAPEGANINFVQRLADGRLRIRTFEKGVEAETLACGTGITAAAIIDCLSRSNGYRTQGHIENAEPGLRPSPAPNAAADSAFQTKANAPDRRPGPPASANRSGRFSTRVRARQAWLSVDFILDSGQPRDVFLTGPAERIR